MEFKDLQLRECKEVNTALREQVTGLSEMLKKLLAEEKKVCRVVAGPVDEQGAKYYKVSGNGGATMLVTFDMPILFADTAIKVGGDVIVVNNHIVGVMPVQLEEKKELPAFTKISWEEIGGLKSQITEIRQAIELPMKHGKLAKEFGLEPLKGVLLDSPPGCGKTIIAKAIASMMLSNSSTAEGFVYVKGPEILNMFVGQAEKRVRELFEQCRQYGRKHKHRAILFIDEAESVVPRRGSRLSSDVESTIVPQFLAEMDGFDEYGPFVILASNLPQSIDPAVLREGRIDLKITINRPTKEDSVEIFGIHLKKVKTAEAIEALATAGAEAIFQREGLPVSGAMIETVVKSATQRAMKRAIEERECKRGVISDDIVASIQQLKLN
jgi:SpoVK/Ycf46/Vps4 family AAA+-type ATPase